MQNFNVGANNSKLSPSSSCVTNLGQQIINEQPIDSQSPTHGISMTSNGDKDVNVVFKDLNPLNFNVGDYLLDDARVPNPTRNPFPTLTLETPVVVATNENNTTSLIVAPLNELDVLVLVSVASTIANYTHVV
jgi:hypothetical protein